MSIPEMIALPDGTVVLSYHEYQGPYRDVEVKHIEPDNNILSVGFVNTDSPYDALGTQVTDLGDGRYLVSWIYSSNHPQNPPEGGYGQVVSYDGSLLGSRFPVTPEEANISLIDVTAVDGAVVTVFSDAETYHWDIVPRDEPGDLFLGVTSPGAVTLTQSIPLDVANTRGGLRSS